MTFVNIFLTFVNLNLLTDKYLSDYKQHLSLDVVTALQTLSGIADTPYNFTFYTSVAVISSSRIEGEQMELDSYVKHKVQDIEYLPELVEKPNDLYKAYEFARQNALTKEHFLRAHSIIAAHLLPEKWRGVYRKNEMLVMEHSTGRIQFEAAPFAVVEAEMNKLWADIEELTQRPLTVEETFYYASFIHMLFVSIHPFNDGNGRVGRLLEKWFLAHHLGVKAWYVRSEKYYYDQVNEYYKHLNKLGMFYEQLDLGKAHPFLQMLPQAINYKG